MSARSWKPERAAPRPLSGSARLRGAPEPRATRNSPRADHGPEVATSSPVRALALPRTFALLQAALAEASLAPSAHNTQPARWQAAPDGRAVLLEDTSRRLNEGDRTGRDHLLSLGAAFEAMSLALSRAGWRLSDPLPAGAARTGAGSSLLPVARAALLPCAGPDPLAFWARERRTYRFRFRPATSAGQERLARLLAARGDAACITGRDALAEVAARYDDSLVQALAPAPVLLELRQWMRLSPDDSGSAVDGLTAAALGLSPALAKAARYLLRPAPFALLRGTGLARHVVSEAAAVESAAAVVVLHAPRGTWVLEEGRALYRLWLELTAGGFSACPMSALLDVPGGERAVARLASLPAAHVPYAVLRVGSASSPPPPRSPRLPADRLLVGGGGPA